MASVLAAFSTGFRLTSRHLDQLMLPTLIAVFVQFVLVMYEDLLAVATNPVPLVILFPFVLIAAAAAQVWLYSRALTYVTHHKNPFRWSAVFALIGYLLIVGLMTQVLLYIFGLSLLAASTSVPIVIGILLLWPALVIFLLVRFTAFIPEIASDRREKDVFERTWQLTSGHFWQIVRFMLLSMLILFAGLAALGIGFLFAYPMVVVSSVSFYNELRKEAKRAA